MKRKISLFITAVCAVIALSGCIRMDDIVLHGVSDFDISLQGSPSVGVNLDVENTSGYNLSVRDASFTITDRNGTPIGKAMVKEELNLPRRSRTDLYIPMKLTFDNPFKALSIAGDIVGNAPSLFVTGSVTVKAGCIKKKFKAEMVPFMEFLRYFDGYGK